MRTWNRWKVRLFRWRRSRTPRNKNRSRRLGMTAIKARKTLARKREIEELTSVLWDQFIEERSRS